MASTFSYVANAAIKELKDNHPLYEEKLWSETSGTMIGDILHSPAKAWESIEDPKQGHSDWLAEHLKSLVAKTERWCDFVFMSPPDGQFLQDLKDALKVLAKKSAERQGCNKIVVRILLGNIIGSPVDCNAVIKDLTKDIPDADKSNLEIWVGAWRKGANWNHAKIIAVDGKEVFTGGHNLWDMHYLREDPMHDISIQLNGDVALQAHLFCNAQWEFIRTNQQTLKGKIVDKLPDGTFLPTKIRVTISEWPCGADTFAPVFQKSDFCSDKIQQSSCNTDEKTSAVLPIVTLGRYGNMAENARSSDDAFIAMFHSTKQSIRCLLQDLGPLNETRLGKKIVYKGWPKHYFRAWSTAMYERGVDIEIVLSNPNSKTIDGMAYSHGWSCEEIAAEIIKTMRDEYPDASESELKSKIVKHLRICFIKGKGGNSWSSSGTEIGLHSKFFILDDICTYIGSQNLYAFDLAEWGVVIDDKDVTLDIKNDVWDPIWKYSFVGNVDESRVIELLEVDRDCNITVGSISSDKLAKAETGVDVEFMKKSPYFGEEE